MSVWERNKEMAMRVRDNCEKISQACMSLIDGVSPHTVAESMGLTYQQLMVKLKRYDNPIEMDVRRDRDKISLNDFLCWDEKIYKDVFCCAEDEVHDFMPQDSEETLSFVLKMYLSDRENAIIKQRYVEGKTLEEVSRNHGVTRERVRNIEAKAIRKLKRSDIRNSLQDGLMMAKLVNARLETAKQDRIRALLARRVESDPDVIDLLTQERKEQEKVEGLPINELDLSVRSFNCLSRAGISTLEKICDLTEMELYKMRNLGKKSVAEIINCVHANGGKMSWEQ